MINRLKRYKPFKKISDKRLLNKNSQSDLNRSDWDFYLEIWELRGSICQVTERPLGEPLRSMFHHILPKSKYPQYRYSQWNIIILHPDVHATVEQDLDKVPKVKMMYEKLLKKHLNGNLPEQAIAFISDK